MPDERINLLPSEREWALTRDYRLRLGVVFVSLIIVLIAAAAVLLVPTYVFLAKSAQVKSEYLAGVISKLSSSDDMAFSNRLKALSNDANVLKALANAPSPSTVVRSVLAVPRPGITLSNFSYASTPGKGPGTLVLSGTAATRDMLRSYQIALQAAPFARSADLPVSAYAKDADIEFTITITLAP